MTWQATPRNKFSFYEDQQWLCTSCMGGGSATTAPEARGNNHAAPTRAAGDVELALDQQAAARSGLRHEPDRRATARSPTCSNYNAMIPVTEQCTGGCAANGGIAGLHYRSIVAGAYVADSDVCQLARVDRRA